jgi:hypothetical protein
MLQIKKIEEMDVINMIEKLLAFIFALSFVFIIAGCSVGIRPAYYDLPPIENNQSYYGEPAYNYYPDSQQTEYKYGYDSTYDPWTMGTYYNYTPPKRVERETEASSSSNSISTNERRPYIRDRNTSTDSSSMSPRRENIAIENRANQNINTQSNSNPQSESSNYKRKREPSSTLDSSKPTSEEKKEDEENKQKRTRN